MTSMFLTDEDLQALTGLQGFAAQCQWLRENGLSFEPTAVAGSVELEPTAVNRLVFSQSYMQRFIHAPTTLIAQAVPWHADEPNAPGVYFFIEQGRITYVGKANRLSVRFATYHDKALHGRWRVPEAKTWIVMPAQIVEDIEEVYIHWLRPKRNERYWAPCPTLLAYARAQHGVVP